MCWETTLKHPPNYNRRKQKIFANLPLRRNLDVKLFEVGGGRLGGGSEGRAVGALAESASRRQRHVLEATDGARRLGVPLQAAEETGRRVAGQRPLLRRADHQSHSHQHQAHLRDRHVLHACDAALQNRHTQMLFVKKEKRKLKNKDIICGCLFCTLRKCSGTFLISLMCFLWTLI